MLTPSHQESVRPQEIIQAEGTRHVVQDSSTSTFPLEKLLVREQPNSQCRRTGHMETVRAVAITPDGKTAITGGDDATIRVWDLKTGREQKVLLGHTSSIVVLQVSPDGKRVFSGSRDGTVRVWNLATGQLIYTFEHPSQKLRLGNDSQPSPIEAIALSPDGQILLSSDGFGNLKVWDLTTGQELSTLGKLNLQALQKSPVLELKFSPDGRSLLIGNLKTSSGQDVISVSRWDIVTGQNVSTLESIPVRQFRGSISWSVGYPLSYRQRYLITATVTISPDGKYAAVETEQGIAVQDLETGDSRQLIADQFRSSSSLSISPDSQTLIAANNKAITTWNIQTGKVLQIFQPPKTLQQWPLDEFFNRHAFAISTDGQTAVNGGKYGSLNLWNLTTGQLKSQLSPPHREVRDVQVSADGNTMVALMHGDDVLVKRWDLTTGQEQIISIRNSDSDYHASHITIAVSPNGKTLVTGHADGSAQVWDAVTGRKLQTLTGDEDLGFATVAISSDGKTLVKGMSHGGLEFWDLQTAQGIRILKTEEHGVSGVAIDADSQTVATVALGSNEIKLWDMQTGQQLRTLKPENPLNSIAISPDNRWLVGGNRDGTVTLWNLQTGEELRTFEVTESAVHSLAILPDGKTLVVGSSDRFIRLWDLSAGKEVLVLDSRQQAGTVRWSGFSLMFNPGEVIFGFVDEEDSPARQDSRSLPKRWQTVTSLAIGSDGKTLFSGSRDGDVKRWDLTAGNAVEAFCGNSPQTTDAI